MDEKGFAELAAAIMCDLETTKEDVHFMLTLATIHSRIAMIHLSNRRTEIRAKTRKNRVDILEIETIDNHLRSIDKNVENMMRIAVRIRAD